MKSLLLLLLLSILACTSNVYAAVVNVRSYGATGDGITDDTAAIVAAGAVVQSGDTLYFPSGTYEVKVCQGGAFGSEYLLSLFGKNGLTITGDGSDSTATIIQSVPCPNNNLGNWVFAWNPWEPAGSSYAAVAIPEQIVYPPIRAQVSPSGISQRVTSFPTIVGEHNENLTGNSFKKYGRISDPSELRQRCR